MKRSLVGCLAALLLILPLKAQAAGPDLTGQWPEGGVTQTCKGVGPKMRCVVKGTFTLQNLGDQASPGSPKTQIRFSLQGEPDVASTKKVGRLAPEASGPVTFSLKLPPGMRATGRALMARIDEANTVAEADEENNELVSPPITAEAIEGPDPGSEPAPGSIRGPELAPDPIRGQALTGSFGELKQSCSGEKIRLRCRVEGTLLLKNQGTQPGRNLWIAIYLGPGRALELWKIKIRESGAGAEMVLPLRLKLPELVNGQGRPLTASLDFTRAVAKTDEQNNLVTSAPIP